jgi:hypothetical protein
MNDLDNPRVEGSWTVLVYIAADNELGASAEKSLKNIATGGSSSSVRTAVQIDRRKGLGATRYIGEGGNFHKEQEIGEIDTGNPRPLIEFLKWGMSRCPAKSYLWVLWGHGAGLDERTQGFTSGDDSGECLAAARIDALSPNQDSTWELFNQGLLEILHDYTTEHYLSNACLRFALDEVRKSTGRTADILGLDACLMGMVEIVCDFRDSVLFAVTSEDTEPRGSWPYKEIVGELVGNPTIDPKGLGTLIVKNYMVSFPASQRRQGLTLSLCDLRKAPSLIEAVKGLSGALRDCVIAGGRSSIEKARALAPRFDRDYVDLQGFCQALTDMQGNTRVAECSRGVIAALRNEFVVYSESDGRNVSHSNGMSIFLPLDNNVRANKSARPHSGNRLSKVPKSVILTRSSYKTLTFVRETGWDKFLLSYLDQNGDPGQSAFKWGGKMSVEKPSGHRKKPQSPRKKPKKPKKKKK